MSVYAKGQLVTAWQHPICFQRNMFFDHATACNSKCQATGDVLAKGDVRLVMRVIDANGSEKARKCYRPATAALRPFLKALFEATGSGAEDIVGFGGLPPATAAALSPRAKAQYKKARVAATAVKRTIGKA